MISAQAQRVTVLGGTGTIGRATVKALLRDGHHVTCILRQHVNLEGATTKIADVTSLTPADFRNTDAIISCLAARTGAPDDAWAIDHDAHATALTSAQQAGVKHFVLLSAICVQKPKLAFQFAKLAFEDKLKSSGLTWTIVRPTAYFKSLSGQVERVKNGKPFLVFGNGALTACKPISDEDLATYLVSCLNDKTKHNQILPIGGPGPAITPLDQANILSKHLNRKVKIRKVPVALLDAIIATLSIAGRVSKRAKAKAELARIGRFYATESMLVWTDHYDADATPETGSQTLAAHYADLLSGKAKTERGDHAVF